MDNCKHALKHYKIVYKDYKQNKNIYDTLSDKTLFKLDLIPKENFKIYKKKSKDYYRKLKVKIMITTILLEKNNNIIKNSIYNSKKL